MRLFVIKNFDNNKYVAFIPPVGVAGSSYTAKLEEARTFATREAAKADACENERVYEVTELLLPPVDP